DSGNGAQQHAQIALLPEDTPHRVGDIAGVEPTRCDLIQQRREGVIVIPINQQHIDRMSVERTGGIQTAESGADDDYSRFCSAHTRPSASYHRVVVVRYYIVKKRAI